jgi:hypothetical protein
MIGRLKNYKIEKLGDWKILKLDTYYFNPTIF